MTAGYKHTSSRRRLPPTRGGVVHEFSIAGHEGFIRTGAYEDGSLGEVFIKMAKQGSTLSGVLDGVATLTSVSLQYGVPLEVLADKFVGMRFEPCGFTSNPEIRETSSVLDYVFRYLMMQYKKIARDGV